MAELEDLEAEVERRRREIALRECEAALEAVWRARRACGAAGVDLKVHDVVERLERMVGRLGGARRGR